MQSGQVSSATQGSGLSTNGQPHIYALATTDRSRLKIGRSVDPIGRIVDLSRVYSDIDLARSVVVKVDTNNVESLLHTVFEPFRLHYSEQVDGYTEWFAGDFVEEVVDLCQNIAHHRRTDYQVIRDLPERVQNYRFEPAQTLSLPRPKKAKVYQPQINPVGFAELSKCHAKLFLRILQERKFQEILIRKGRYLLIRPVLREEEPECWLRSTDSSDWGRRLMRAGAIRHYFDDDTHTTNLVMSTSFVPTDAIRGREYYWLNDEWAKAVFADSGCEIGEQSPSFEAIHEFLAPLPRRIDDRVYKEKWQIERDQRQGGMRK